MQETSAQAYGRALAAWSQWLRHWCHTREPHALRTALVCKQIAVEKLAVWQAELAASRPAVRAARTERAARTDLSLETILREIRRDERGLRAVRKAARGARREAARVAGALNLETTP